MSADDSFRALRASALQVELPDGSEVTIPPPSLQQAFEALKLDPRAGTREETDREQVTRLFRQAQILVGPANAHVLEVLTMGQAGELVTALYLTAAGVDPANFVAYQRKLAEQEGRSAAELLAEVNELTITLAAELRITPAEAARMPVADALAVRERLARNADEKLRTDAALHRIPLA